MPVANPALYAGMPQGWTVQDALSLSEGGGDQNLVTGGATNGTSSALAGVNENGFITDVGTDVANVVANTTAIAQGTLYMSKMIFPQDVTVTNAWYDVTATVAVTPTHGFFGLVDVNGNLWANSADQLTTMLTTAGVQKTAYATPTAIPAGTYWQVMVSVGAATNAKLGTPSLTNVASLNINLVAGTYRFGVGATSFTGTTVAAFQALFPLTMSSQTSDTTVAPWAAAS